MKIINGNIWRIEQTDLVQIKGKAENTIFCTFFHTIPKYGRNSVACDA